MLTLPITVHHGFHHAGRAAELNAPTQWTGHCIAWR
jgi:hypothetical protein